MHRIRNPTLRGVAEETGLEVATADDGEMDVLPPAAQGGKAVDERRIPLPGGQAADGKEQAVPFGHLQG